MAEQQFWVPDLLPLQIDILNCYKRYLLVEGPRLSGKTIGVLNKIARHLWETDRAEAAIFTKIIKTAKNAGVYEEFCVSIMQDWMAHGLFKGRWIKKGPETTDNVTKTPYLVVENMWGTHSRLSLFNCAEDREVEQRTKSTRFSLVYFPELSNFADRVVFDATKVQLRCRHLKYEEHQWIGDTNPAEEGEESWIWKLWFKEKYLPAATEDQRQFRDELHSIHFEISDNTKIDPREVADLKASYEYNPDLFERYIRGKWTASTTNSHFSDLFIPNIHIVGDAFGADRESWEMLVPDDTCHELLGGFDLGAVNHAACIASKRVINNEVTIDVIDELVFLKTQISIEDFTYLYMEMMDKWEAYLLREYGTKEIHWRFWSDDSAFQYRSAADSHDELIVRNASEGRIMLGAAPKAKGSVKMRVNIMRKLLFQKRIFFSAQLFETIRMMKGLKKGPTLADFVDRLDPLKHVFDAITYLLFGELPMDAQNRTRPKVERRSSVVAVGL